MKKKNKNLINAQETFICIPLMKNKNMKIAKMNSKLSSENLKS
jgi:hypothetical protein